MAARAIVAGPGAQTKSAGQAGQPASNRHDRRIEAIQQPTPKALTAELQIPPQQQPALAADGLPPEGQGRIDPQQSGQAPGVGLPEGRRFDRQFRGEGLMPSGIEALAGMGMLPLPATIPSRTRAAWMTLS